MLAPIPYRTCKYIEYIPDKKSTPDFVLSNVSNVQGMGQDLTAVTAGDHSRVQSSIDNHSSNDWPHLCCAPLNSVTRHVLSHVKKHDQTVVLEYL